MSDLAFDLDLDLEEDELPFDHLDRVFGRNMSKGAWRVVEIEIANDDDFMDAADTAQLLSMLKRRRGR